MLRNIETFLAQIIAVIFHPLFLINYTFFLFLHFPRNNIYNYFLSSREILLSMILFVIGTIVIPLLVVALMNRSLTKKNIARFSHMEQNVRLTVLVQYYIVAAIFLFLVFDKELYPEILQVFMVIINVLLLLPIILIFIGTLARISLHMIASGGIVGTFLCSLFFSHYLNHYVLILAIIIAGLVGFSRLKLSAHTQKEVYLGFVLGLIGAAVTFFSYFLMY